MLGKFLKKWKKYRYGKSETADNRNLFVKKTKNLSKKFDFMGKKICKNVKSFSKTGLQNDSKLAPRDPKASVLQDIFNIKDGNN